MLAETAVSAEPAGFRLFTAQPGADAKGSGVPLHSQPYLHLQLVTANPHHDPREAVRRVHLPRQAAHGRRTQ
jgi:hypothetical protein